MERLRNKAERHRILKLWNGLLIGLSFQDKRGFTYKLNHELRLCSVFHDDSGAEHLLYVGNIPTVDLFSVFDISDEEWTSFEANVALNEVTEKNPLVTGGLLKR